MPNWTSNELYAEGIEKLDIYSKDSEGDLFFDFNKVIPMPEDIKDTVAGGDEDEAIVYYLAPDRANCCNPKIEKRIKDICFPHRVFHPSFPDFIVEMYKKIDGKLYGPGTNLMTSKELHDLGQKYVKNYDKYGYTDWFDWSIDNWGTKSNAVDCIVGNGRIEFDTAWCMPEPVIRTLSIMYPAMKFTIHFENEGENEWHTFVYQDGKTVSI